MSANSKTHKNEHVDESEVFRNHSLSLRQRRQKMQKIMYVVVSLVMITIVAACVFAYFFDKR